MRVVGQSSPGRRLLYYYLLTATMLALLLFVSSIWLPQGGLLNCDTLWHPCVSIHSPTHVVPMLTTPLGGNMVPMLTTPLGGGGDVLPGECPGQRFQVARLLKHLDSALSPDSAIGPDVLLQPYLSTWDELIKFMDSLGPLVGFFSQKVQEKLSVIRDLQQDFENDSLLARGEITMETDSPEKLQVPAPSRSLGAYQSVRSMIQSELNRGVVRLDAPTWSGCRSLLRLHRSLLWLQLLLKGVAEGPDAQGRLRTPAQLCREAYQHALAPHHPWLIRSLAEVAFSAMPERSVFLGLVCVHSQDEAAPILQNVITAIEKVYQRTQWALEEQNMLELP